MSRGSDRPARSGPRPPARKGATLPPTSGRDFLDSAVAAAFERIAPLLPEGAYLVGGAAMAAHYRHRITSDLDFFFHGSVDLDALSEAATALDGVVVSHRDSGTLRLRVGQVKVEFLNADHNNPQRRIADPVEFAGVPVADPRDLMAMKLMVVRQRGALRDYFDLMTLDRSGQVSLEQGLALTMMRYNLTPDSPVLTEIIFALARLNDLDPDAQLPMSKADLEQWWRARQAQLVRNLNEQGA